MQININQKSSLQKVNQPWDAQAFYDLYDRYYRVMVGYALRLVKTEVIAEDIAQEAFVTLWNKREDVTDHSTIVKLLYVCVRNRCIDHLKHESVKRAYSTNVIPETEGNLEEEVFAGEVYVQLFTYIDKLPARQRDTMLHVINGKKNAEIAELMGVSIETVKHQKSKAVQTLKSLFTSEDKVALLSLLNIILMS